MIQKPCSIAQTPAPLLGTIAGPTLILVGEEDALATCCLKSAGGHPRCDLRRLATAGHLSNLETLRPSTRW
jgi:hypothetical protein